MKSLRAVALLAAATMLASCSAETEQSPGELPEQQFTSVPSAEEENSAEPEEKPAAPAPSEKEKPADPNVLAFENRQITLGPVDPNKAATGPFSVCAELTDAEWGKLGFTKGDNGEYMGVPYCALNPRRDEPGTVYAMTSVPGSMEDLVGKAEEAAARYRAPNAEIKIPGVASFEVDREEGFGCVAAVETITGTVMAGAANVGGDKNFDQLCHAAEDMLDGFYELGR